MDRKIKPPDLFSQRAQQSAQGELISGTSGIGIKRPPPTTSQPDQSAKKKPKKLNNENEGDVSTILQESDESAQQSAQGEPVSGTSGLGPSTSQQDQSAKKKPKKSNNENEGNVSTMLQESDESDEAEALPNKEKNYIRCYYLCQEIGTKAIRSFFDREVPGHILESFLKHHRSRLTYRNGYTKEQQAKLFPGGQVVVASVDFDISLLYKLIRNLLTTIPPPTSGWGKRPSPEHLNEADSIEKIRLFRNLLANSSNCKINDTDFSFHWTNLSQAIDRLSKGSLSTAVESVRMTSFDKCIEDKRKEKKIHIPLNIRKGHIELIKRWTIEDKPFYDETGGFTAALKMVKSENYMTIIGGPGSGKTATARHIALQLEEQGWEVVPVCRLEEIIQYGDRDHKQVFVLDDVLGIFAFDVNIYNYFINHKEQIFKAIGGTSKLLFTCRRLVYKESLKVGLFVTENVVDLQSKDNQLTETEKRAISQYHCKAKGVNPDLYTSLSFTKANHMFPFLCKLFSMEEKYQQLGENFFNKPFEYFIIELDKLQRTNTIQYAVLVLCLVNGKLSVEHLPHKYMQEEVFNNCGVNLDTPGKQIKDAICHMSETYFTKLDTEYTFTHGFMFEAIAYHYGSQIQNQQQILKYLSSSYIANKVTVWKQASNEDLCIHISEDMYLPLAKRLYTDIQSMNLFDVFMNKSLNHGSFLDVFIGMLKTKPFDEFESLILRKHENIRYFVQKTFSFDEYVNVQKRSDITELVHLYLLFDQVQHEKSDPEHNVRVISWILYCGHTHLLQEIVNHVEFNNHNISLIFGSDVKENARLLVLGCYSDTLDMVELILKYVNPKCIDMDLISYGTSSHCNFYRQDTPLTVACEIGNLCIVKALLRIHTDINQGQPPLFAASKYGHCHVIKYLLTVGAEVNLLDERRQSPLFIATVEGHCDVVQCLLSSGAFVNLRDESGQSPLLIASMEGHFDVVESLLNFDANINLGCCRRETPLFVASMRGHCDVVKYLLSSDADINLCDQDGQSPLLIASVEGHCDVVNCLLSYGAEINFSCCREETPLFVASTHGHCDVVKCLLSCNADINLCDKDRQSPLFIASYHGQCDVVKCLLSSNADIKLCNKTGESSLFAASEKGHCDVVKCLLSSGADINLCDECEQSPLFIASMYGRCDVVECLLISGAKINLYNEQGQSPLFIASLYGCCDVVKCLLSSGADIDLFDECVQSSLFIASMYGYHDVVKCLLSSGADINLCDEGGRSPLLAASAEGHCDVVKCLLSSGADFNLRDVDGQSALIAASSSEYYDIVRLLTAHGDLREENNSNA